VVVRVGKRNLLNKSTK